MKAPVAFRMTRDRLRYSFTFELSLMAFLILAGVLFFNKSYPEIGFLCVLLSLKALLVSLLFNWIFDRFEARRGRVSSFFSLGYNRLFPLILKNSAVVA
ncbi:MAG: chlorhexidine efflux transporter [Pikeienuella sp.]